MPALILNAEQIQFDQYMSNVLGIAQVEARNALLAQGLGTVLDFNSRTEHNIEDVSKIVRRSGGTIPNPEFEKQPGQGIPPQPAVLPNPGLPIGHLHEKSLKMLRYFIFHLQRVQREFDLVIATMNTLQQVYLLKDVDKEESK
jgi:hypothetical protein